MTTALKYLEVLDAAYCLIITVIDLLGEVQLHQIPFEAIHAIVSLRLRKFPCFFALVLSWHRM